MKLFKLKDTQANQTGKTNQTINTNTSTTAEHSSNAAIKILGSGCKKCNQLEEATKQALQQLNIDEPIEHVTDFADIAAYGVMSTPALVVDGKVVSYGKVLSVDDAKKLIAAARK